MVSVVWQGARFWNEVEKIEGASGFGNLQEILVI